MFVYCLCFVCNVGVMFKFEYAQIMVGIPFCLTKIEVNDIQNHQNL